MVTDGDQRKVQQNADSSGAFRFESVVPGNAKVSVEVDGYMVQIIPVEVKAHRDSAIDLMLRPLPKLAEGHRDGRTRSR